MDLGVHTFHIFLAHSWIMRILFRSISKSVVVTLTTIGLKALINTYLDLAELVIVVLSFDAHGLSCGKQ